MNILHITAWYPNRSNPLEAIWIKRFVEAIPSIRHHKVYHITVTPGKSFSLKAWDEGDVHHCVWQVPTKRWIIIEVLNFLLLLYYLGLKRIHNDFHIINFHIAYPQLVFWKVLRHITKKPAVIFEHWSAYHYNFGARKRLPRIQNIFRCGLPLITVSRGLLKDIEVFSERKMRRGFVVPNVVDTRVFMHDEATRVNANTFLMISQWKPPKRPDVVIKAFARLTENEPNGKYKLRIGGFGQQLPEIKGLVDFLNLGKSVVFLGTLDSATISMEMNQCDAFLHCSDYETFSVVCAESISCGTPVIASAVGGITEFIGSSNGKLVMENNVSQWFSALRDFNREGFDRKTISAEAAAKFSAHAVGNRYLNILEDVGCVTK